MLTRLSVRCRQFTEMVEAKGFWPTCKLCVYECREAVPVVKDLSTLKDQTASVCGNGCRIIEINREPIADYKLQYPLKSRAEKAEANLSRGLRSFALVEQNLVLADVWLADRTAISGQRRHRDLRLFDIDLQPGEVYMFDLFLTAEKRGKATATTFMQGVLHQLKERGVKKAYGYFVRDNTPALWVHRLLGYEELPAFIMKRYGVFETARRKDVS